MELLHEWTCNISPATCPDTQKRVNLRFLVWSSGWGIFLIIAYHIYSNKRHGAYLIFCTTSAALIWGQRLFKNLHQMNLLFLYFYSTVHFLPLNFLMDWYLTDGKYRITREIHAVKKPESFLITRAKISAVRANFFVVLGQFSVFPGYMEFLE